MLFNEPKLLKLFELFQDITERLSFSALQRAEIAEIALFMIVVNDSERFSALQRAEIAEIYTNREKTTNRRLRFSALQRAEIAEIGECLSVLRMRTAVSVLFNEPKLLK